MDYLTILVYKIEELKTVNDVNLIISVSTWHERKFRQKEHVAHL